MGDAKVSCDLQRRRLTVAIASALGLTACATNQPSETDAAERAAKDQAAKAAAKQAAEKAAAERAVAERAAAAKAAVEKAAALKLESDRAEELYRIAKAEQDRATAHVDAINNAIRIDASDVKAGDLDDLIRVIKKKGGERLSSASVKSITDDLARTFVDYAWIAVDKGYPIPDSIIRRLPPRKVVLPILGVVPIFGVATFAIWGVWFTVPVATFLTAAVAAVLVTGSAMALAVGALLSSDSPRKA